MKLSVVTPFPYKEEHLNFKQIAELGYDGVEIAIRDPKVLDKKFLKKELKKYKLEVPNLVTGQAYTVDGLSMTHDKSTVRKAFVKRFKDNIDLASELESKVIIGWVRGLFKDCKSGDPMEYFTDTLTQCAEYAKPKGVELLIEPLNRYETDSFLTLKETADYLYEVKLKNVKMVADVFHMNIEEEKPIHEAMFDAREYLGHLHVADNTREVPGKGCLPFNLLFWALEKMKYEGFVSVEALRLKPNAYEAAKFAISYLKKVM